MARTKLTDKQKKKIIADYITNGNYSETGRMNNVSDNTVRAVIKSNPDVSKKIEQKKEDNTNDILEYLDNISDKQRKIIDLTLDTLEKKLTNPNKEKYKSLNVKDIATVYGIIYDKSLKAKELKLRNSELEKSKRDIEDLTTLADMLGFGDK